MTIKEAIAILTEDLTRKEYSPKTIGVYNDWIKKLGKYYPKKNVEEFEQKELEEFMIHLSTRMQVAPASIHQAFHAYRYLLNDILHLGLDFDRIKKPKRSRSNPDIFTPDEILQLIKSWVWKLGIFHFCIISKRQ